MIVGILGGIASGKSTVTQMLVELGAEALDADRMAHEVLETPDTRKMLVKWLGRKILRTDGTVDREAIAERVFSRPKDLERLENIVHPAVIQRIEEKIREFQGKGTEKGLLVLDVPLLVSTSLKGRCSAFIYVDVPWEVRRRRVETRGWDAEELERRESFQVPEKEKRELANFVIDNSGSVEETRRQVRECHLRLKELKGDAPGDRHGPEERHGRIQ